MSVHLEVSLFPVNLEEMCRAAHTGVVGADQLFDFECEGLFLQVKVFFHKASDVFLHTDLVLAGGDDNVRMENFFLFDREFVEKCAAGRFDDTYAGAVSILASYERFLVKFCVFFQQV